MEKQESLLKQLNLFKASLLFLAVLQILGMVLFLTGKYYKALEVEAKGEFYNWHFWNPFDEMRFPLFLLISALLLFPNNFWSKFGALIFSSAVVYSFALLILSRYVSETYAVRETRSIHQIIFEFLYFCWRFQPQLVCQLFLSLGIFGVAIFDFSLKAKQIFSKDKLK